MLAHLYIHPDKIRYNTLISEEEYAANLNSWAKDMSYIIMHHGKENKFEVHSDIFFTSILGCSNIFEYLATHNRIAMGAIMQIIGKQGENSKFTCAEVEEKSKYREDEQECHALVVLNEPGYADNPNFQEKVLNALCENPERDEKEIIQELKEEWEKVHAEYDSRREYIEFDQYAIVYSRNSWKHLRMQILGNHPGTPEEFLKNCQEYFTNIEFGSSCVDEIEDCLEKMPRQIVKYLYCVNEEFDKFFVANQDKGDLIRILEGFCGRYRFDTVSSPQGGHTDPEDYTKKDRTGVERSCGYHFKINQTDPNCKGDDGNHEKKHCRIHFNYQAKAIPPQSKMFVGLILRHL